MPSGLCKNNFIIFALKYYKKHIMQRRLWIFIVLAALAASSCKEDKFELCGVVSGAEGKMLYFEHTGIDEITLLDSVKLSSGGRFSFRSAAVDAPEFYRLRIEGKVINVAIDSSETVNINASYRGFGYKYETKGSEDCEKLKELALLQMDLQKAVDRCIEDPQLKIYETRDSIDALIRDYKNRIKNSYIYKAPDKAYSYFALFQTIILGNVQRLIFNPRADEEDIKAFAAVGTSWDTFYPGSIRAKNLHNITIESMKNIKILRMQESQTIDPGVIDTSGVVDISLKDNKGIQRKLSDLKGNVVLLDFCSFAQDGTNMRIMAMREVYNKYHSRGFEVYQVSVDGEEHFWKTQTAALPWVSVNDPDGLESIYLMKYNVQKLPSYFLLQRDCTPYKRDEQVENLDKEIESLL